MRLDKLLKFVIAVSSELFYERLTFEEIQSPLAYQNYSFVFPTI